VEPAGSVEGSARFSGATFHLLQKNIFILNKKIGTETLVSVPRLQINMTTVARIYPNGEFTFGQDTSKRRKATKLDRLSDRLLFERGCPALVKETSQLIMDQLPENSFLGKKFRVAYTGSTIEYIRTTEQGETVIEIDSSLDGKYQLHTKESMSSIVKTQCDSTIPLGLSDSRILGSTRKYSKKLNRMTSSMGRNLRNAVYLMERKYGKSNLSFLTLTCPTLPDDSMNVLNRNWGKAINIFTKWLRGVIAEKGFHCDYAYCSEMQEQRVREQGDLGLHLHLVFNGRAKARTDWFVNHAEVRAKWAAIITLLTGEVDYDKRALENIQSIKKSAARYLSKYISKGIPDELDKYLKPCYEKPRIHWGGMSRSISRAIKKQSTRLTDTRPGLPSAATRFVRNLQYGGTQEHCSFLKISYIPISCSSAGVPGSYLQVGVGCIKHCLNRLGIGEILTRML
jgi:hypothetical protein